MHAGAASEMQGLFPEGHLFMNTLYGLAWADLIGNISDSPPGGEVAVRTEAEQEVTWALAEMDSPNGRRIFQEKLPLPYGVFYRGWSNYLRAKKLEGIPPGRRSAAGKSRFQMDSDAIANAFDANSCHLAFKPNIAPASAPKNECQSSKCALPL